jgi:hypothetical protein
MPLPKTLNGWITLIIGLALAVLPIYIATTGDHPPLWAVLAQGGLAYLALAIKGGGKEIGKGSP